MKCPKTFVAKDIGGGLLKIFGPECIREQCPWYYPSTQQCAPDRTASNLNGINNALTEILHKINKEVS